MSSARITYSQHPNVTPEAELSTLATIYKFILFDSQASNGGLHDLTKHSAQECKTSQDKKGTQNADLRGD